MKKLSNVLFLSFFSMLFFLSGCGMDNYENVPEKTERVCLGRPYAIYNRDAGVEVSQVPLETGQRNHGNGPCAAYDFSMAIQSAPLHLEVKTADNINMPFDLDVGFRVREGKSIDLALNYMPPILEKDGNLKELSRLNFVEIIQVPINKIFEQNIFPFADEASRDVIDSYRSKDIRIGELSQTIKIKLIERLAKHKIPKVVFKDGQFIYPEIKFVKGKPTWDGPSICITDCIEIVRVSIKNYKNPNFINTEINKIEAEKTEVQKLQSELKQWKTKKKIKMTEADHARKTAVNIKEMLKRYPHMMKLQKLKNLENVESNAQPGDSTEIYFVPENMMNPGMWQMMEQKNSLNGTVTKSPQKGEVKE